MSNEILRGLMRPFEARQISWRVGATDREKTKGIALAYIDARDVMQRLDEVMGLNWQCRYSHADKKTICDIGLKLNNEWVWRSGGAGDTDVEAEKGAISDAFKRAAVLWGIGRYLYSLPNKWVAIKEHGKSYALAESQSLPAWATPEGYDKIMAKRDRPAGAGPITATSGDWEALSLDMQDYLLQVVAEAQNKVRDGDVEGAAYHIESQNLQPSEYSALQSKLDSKTRAKIHSYYEERKAA